MQLKDEIEFAYGDSLRAGATTRADWEARKLVETHGQDGDDVESEEGANVLEMESYFISSEIPEY